MFDKKTKLMNFSVLISVYIKENPDYLREALDSIWTDQLLKPSEIVLVEDGPLTESLYNVISSFKDKAPIKIVKLNENVGLGPALQKGLAECSYELVARMDSDDISLPKRFKIQVEFFSDNPDIDLIGSNIDEFLGERTNIVSKKKVPEYNDDIRTLMPLRNPINHPSVMFRKSSIIEVGGYLPSLYNEDYYLWARLMHAGKKLYNIQESLLMFRLSKDLYNRRGGFAYVKSEFILQRKFYDIGIVNFPLLISNLLIRSCVRLLPNVLRRLVYKRLRK